jgi:hypothetical protein
MKEPLEGRASGYTNSNSAIAAASRYQYSAASDAASAQRAHWESQ